MSKPAVAARPLALEAFIAAADAVVASGGDDRAIARGIAAALEPALRAPDLLLPEQRQSAVDRYRQHLIYADPAGRYSVVALVWQPGQETPIHDHVAWCVVGVYQGAEFETCYRLLRDRAGTEHWLEVTGSHSYLPGHTTCLVPPDENIHKVSNAGRDTAISIHVYGADIARLGSSINYCLNLPVLPFGARDGEPVPWRPAAPNFSI